MKIWVQRFIALSFLVGIYAWYAFYLQGLEDAETKTDKVEEVVKAQLKDSPFKEKSVKNTFLPVKTKEEVKHRETTFFKSILRSCFDADQEIKNTFQSADEFTSEMTKKLGEYKDKDFSWQNVHFEKDNGDMMRLRVFMASGANGDRKKLVLYKEDSDGFPVQVKIDEKDIWNPTIETVKKYIGSNKVVYDELAETTNFANGAVFTKSIDGRVVEAQVTTETGHIQCLFE